MITQIGQRLRELKRTAWINSTYLRRPRWESIKVALSSILTGPTVLFFPDYPHGAYIIRKLCAYGGVEVTRDPESAYDLGFFFTDKTFAAPAHYGLINDAFINCNCTDISKTSVQDTFEEVFGYSLSVNPVTYEGEVIEKSNLNAKHDGRVVSCPIREIKEDCVYQKRVDNRVEEHTFLDYRTTIVGNSVPVVVSKYWRAVGGEIPGEVVAAHAMPADDVFTSEEIGNLLTFSREMGLDYGELDVLRDNENGKLYVVDANSTPIGPREELSDADYRTVLDRMLAAFNRRLLRKQS